MNFQKINEQMSLIIESSYAKIENLDLRFNDGRFNKNGSNTIYLDDNPIVDFGVGGIGLVKVGGKVINNAIYLKGGYNASEQGRGYGALGISFIFKKLPKIQNLVLQCYDTACPFWMKMGGKNIASKDISGSGKLLHTLVINRADFQNSGYNSLS